MGRNEFSFELSKFHGFIWYHLGRWLLTSIAKLILGTLCSPGSNSRDLIVDPVLSTL